MSAFAKYRHAFVVGLQSNLVYRGNFAVRGVFSLVHLAAVVILWTAAYASGGEIGGFTLGETITYFVVLLALQFLISAFSEDYQISEEIRNGLINQFLTKPINYYLYRLSVFFAARVVTTIALLLPLGLAWPVLHEHLTLPGEAWRFLAFLPALLMSALIQFTIAYCFGLLTFWFLEIQSIVILSMALESVLGGQIFPLDLLPAAVFRVSQFLPYYYQMYFPAAILTGRIDQPAVVEGLFVQAFWVVALLGVAQLLWTRGLRRHTAVGG